MRLCNPAFSPETVPGVSFFDFDPPRKFLIKPVFLAGLIITFVHWLPTGSGRLGDVLADTSRVAVSLEE